MSALAVVRDLEAPPVEPIRVRLLGAFSIERGEFPLPDSAWRQRRAAKTLIKLLAANTRHALHREQILEALWQDAYLESALNSLGKALHAARRALEPALRPRDESAYIHFRDGIVTLDMQRVQIDADHFQHLAEVALRSRTVLAYETGLAAYGGELLPDDRYEDWATERRDYLAQLHVRMLIGLGDALEEQGAYGEAADRLRAALRSEPAREDVHRRLMRLYAAMGRPLQAIRQFEICRDVLRRELDITPEVETEALYQEILDNRNLPSLGDQPIEVPAGEVSSSWTVKGIPDAPLVGRGPMLELLRDGLRRAATGQGGLALIGGEAGIGKSRLISEFAAEATWQGVTVLRGATESGSRGALGGPFAMALERYVAGRRPAERVGLSRRYTALRRIVPSLDGVTFELEATARARDDHAVGHAVARLLTDLAAKDPVVVILGDLNHLHPAEIGLLQYLAHLAAQRRWLLVGSLRNETLELGVELRRMLDATPNERNWIYIELDALSRPECDALVRSLRPDRRFDDGFLDDIYARSLGNPFFITELLREMVLGPFLAPPRPESGPVPSSPVPAVPIAVRARVRAMVAGLDDSTRRVLALIAAAATAVTLDDLRIACLALDPPIPEPAVMDALDRGLQLRIVAERADGFGFRHPLVQAALYENLPVHRREQLIWALQTSTRTRAGLRDDEPEGARRLAEAYGALVDRLERAGRLTESAEAAEKLAMALIARRRYDRAMHVLEQAARAYSAVADAVGVRRVAGQVELISSLRGEARIGVHSLGPARP